MTFDPSLLLVGGAGGILYSIRQYPIKLYNKIKQSFIYTVTVYQYDELFDMLELWLSENHKTKYRDVEASVREKNTFHSLDSEDIPISIVYKQEENYFVIKYKNKRVIISKTKEKIDKAQNIRDLYFRKYVISGWKSKEIIDLLLNDAIKFSENKKNQNSIKLYNSDTYGNWYAPTTKIVKPINKVILNSNTKNTIISDLDEFISSENWYIESSIPYKRGYCFYGPPGTGKTTLALAIANYLKRNVYTVNLNSIEDDTKIPYIFSSLPHNSIILLEDIDKVFSGRENVSDKSKVTFSCLLNCLDGAFSKHGLITIITTNHIEKLDPALLRTGRIDVKIEVPRPEQSEIEQYISVFYNKALKFSNDYSFDLTMSDVQEICLQNKKDSPNAIEALITFNKLKKVV
jgi:mitochondrial chaperone BCS1